MSIWKTAEGHMYQAHSDEHEPPIIVCRECRINFRHDLYLYAFDEAMKHLLEHYWVFHGVTPVHFERLAQAWYQWQKAHAP